MRRTLLALILAVAALPAGRALGGQYRFEVKTCDVVVTVNRDGSADIHYAIRFRNKEGYSPLDIVDIGMPNLGKHRPVLARIDGHELPASSIRISTELKPRGCGYEVHLGGYAISPGREGLFEFFGHEEGMVWQDTTDPSQASFRFGTTWFGSRYVTGGTRLTVRYRLPIPGADLEKVHQKILYHKKGEAKWIKNVFEGEDVVSVGWGRTVSFTQPHTFSVSFPKKYVSNVREKTLWGLFYEDWWKKSPGAQLVSGIVLLIAFAIIFFVASRGTGWSVFIVLAILLGVLMYNSPGWHLLLYPIIGGVGFLVAHFRGRRKKHYFPASMCREGGGVKRGLTAVEAAVLLEVPLNKILTMIIFGLAKKGVIKIAVRKPLRLESVGEEKSPGVWMLPGDAPVKLWPYEPDFVAAFKVQGFKTVEEMRLKKPFDNLIQLVAGSLKGFDLVKTRDYYKFIVGRAWKQVKAESDYEARFEQTDKKLDWLMLDDDWGSGMRGPGGRRYHYQPWWWYGHSHRTYTGQSGGGLLGGGGGGVPDVTAPDTSFSDVANSLTGRLEGLSNSLTGSLDSVAESAGKGLDLSGFDKFTTDALESMAKGGGSGGGGGGFGGCACAGCACACACAGGGR